jgi:integrase
MLAKQAKVLSPQQVKAALSYLERTRHPARNKVIFLLSLRAGLRAKEIASLTWGMITDPEGDISDCVRITDAASKGLSGGVIPIAQDLLAAMRVHQIASKPYLPGDRVIRTKGRTKTSAQVIVNMFSQWYGDLGFYGCSSHSGRRTFITRAARNIGRFGGSMRA